LYVLKAKKLNARVFKKERSPACCNIQPYLSCSVHLVQNDVIAADCQQALQEECCRKGAPAYLISYICFAFSNAKSRQILNQVSISHISPLELRLQDTLRILDA